MQSEEPEDTKTLLDWAMQLCPDSPRKRVKEWIASGRFYLNGDAVTQANLLLENPEEMLTFGAPDSVIASWAHRRRIHPKLVVLHMDESFAIVDKNAGLLSVPSSENKGISALSVLEDYLNDDKGDVLRRRLFGSIAKVTPQAVHRLDQYTSGILCIALNDDARANLIDQLRSHDLLREYIAFSDGELESRSGTWESYMRLDDHGYNQRVCHEYDEGATRAVTHFEVMAVYEKHHVSKLRLRLETGLKHQIRIHAAAAGVPLVGDRLYHDATRKALERKGATLPYGFGRQALHAAVIGLKHPKTGKDLRFESQLPGDMSRLESRFKGSQNLAG